MNAPVYTEETMAAVQNILEDMAAKQKAQEYQRDQPILLFPKLSETHVPAAETRIGLPEGVTAGKASKILAEYEQAMQEEVRTVRKIKCRLEDLQVAVNRVCMAYWGTTGRGVGTPASMFAPKQPPVKLEIPVGVTDAGIPITETVNVTEFVLEPLDAKIDFGSWEHEEYGTCGLLSVISLKKNEQSVKNFIDAVERQATEISIYRGRVVEFKLRKNPQPGQGKYELTHRAVKGDRNIVYTRTLEKELEFGLFGCIREAKNFSKAGIKSIFRTLLYGPYGTGKTECTMQASAEATENGWTTVFFSPGQDDGIKDLEAARNLAALYAPSLLVVEDIDRYFDDNSDKNNKAYVTNLLDGMGSKNSGVSILMTTNHLDNIPSEVNRAGRMDSLIEVGFLDREAIERLFLQLLGDELDESVDFDAIYDMVQDTGPSFIRGTFDLARKNSIISTGGLGATLGTDDLVFAAKKQKAHSEIHMTAPAKSDAQLLMEAISVVATYQNSGVLKSATEMIESLRRQMNDRFDNM